MDLLEKKRQVSQLYEEYERLVQPYKTLAVCEKGCASCCIDVGSVGATTLEGLIILEYIQGWDRQTIKEINRNLRENRNDKLNQVLARCAFLDQEQNCRIYAVRPFSCRRLYSVRKCDGQGAVVHRQAVMVGQKIEKELQKLDADGCSGHLSFILHLLEKNGFRQDYLWGNWSTENFKDIIERYELVVHRRTSREKRER
ncbi:MAG: YkgJ family cysteine cluster protein [Deltaproteobacteria bacterium]|jgi:Fe-S-cluster containining protein|nr:YkgJ family cysteine cluster protein [Deltaproteobacteria bacterium]